MTIAIPVTGRRKGDTYTAYVDDEFAYLAREKWRPNREPNGGHIYAVRSDGRGGLIHMHRVVLGLQGVRGSVVDHIDGDGLNNCRKNLRVGTVGQNNQNRGANRVGTSRHRGVYWKKSMSRWAAEARISGTKFFLGYFQDEEEAARVVAEWRAQNMPWSPEATSKKSGRAA